MITARFLPKYPKRVDVTDGLTKSDANGVMTLGLDRTELNASVASAAASAAAASASYDVFDQQYLGSKPADPFVDNKGGALINGAMYFNTSGNILKVWNGGSWQPAAGGNVTGPLSSASGNVATFNSATGDLIVDSGISARGLNDGALLNAIRAAESTGSGVSADGKIFVDLLNSTKTLNMTATENSRFVRGGVTPNPEIGAYADVTASVVTSGENPGWANNTVVSTISSDAIVAGARSKDYLRLTFRAGSGGTATIGYIFVGLYSNDDLGFDPLYPVVPVFFAGDAVFNLIAAGAAAVTSPFNYSIPEGKSLRVAFVCTDGGHAATKNQANWSCHYKLAADEPSTVAEPAKIHKDGYTSTGGTTLFLEKVEYASAIYNDMAVVSKALPVSSVPTKADVVAFVDGQTATSANLLISLSRDGATWKQVTWSDYYTLNGRRGIAAFGVDMTTGAGAGSNLYWQVITDNANIRISSIGVRQTAGVFTDVPSVPLVPGDPIVTNHNEGTGLGYGSPPSYGRLWGFTQDHEITGPTRFHVKFKAGLVHSHPSLNVPVLWTVAATARYYADKTAAGAPLMVETDTDGYLNDSLNWLKFDNGNVTSQEEHYKNGYLTFTVDKLTPGVYRFEVCGYSATSVDSPLQPDVVSVKYDEELGASAREFKYNWLEIVAEPLR